MLIILHTVRPVQIMVKIKRKNVLTFLQQTVIALCQTSLNVQCRKKRKAS